ncbi:MAG: HNH endonuclease [Gemmatimonadaceae bacterium]|nr:HNH endonuclease [Gemmatimonadaceae bacterium]
MKRAALFARDEHRCVYCGQVFEAEELSVDHVQPRMRGGDGSPGNLVTACRACNTRKGGRSLPQFLLDEPEARRNFFAQARYVWPRHLKAVAEELARRGAVASPTELVEGVRWLRSSEAIADVVQAHDPQPAAERRGVGEALEPADGHPQISGDGREAAPQLKQRERE